MTLDEEPSQENPRREKRRIHCNYCGHETWHELRARHEEEGSTPGYDATTGEVVGDLEYSEAAEIWTCCGCDITTFRRWTDFYDGEIIDTFYPPRSHGYIHPKDFRKLPRQLRGIYREIIDTFNGRSHILCAAGLRALLEGICNDKGVTGSSFNKKIDGLNQFVPEGIVANLHSFRFLGNVALHRLQVPTAQNLGLAIEVLEDVMNAIYELDYKSGRLMQALQQERQAKGS